MVFSALGPPKDGIQRAVLDEVAGNTVVTDFSGMLIDIFR